MSELNDAERKELDALREWAGGRSVLPKVIEQLGPMSLWSYSALNAHIEREVQTRIAAMAKTTTP